MAAAPTLEANSQPARPGKLAWRLFLSVILIYGLSFARHFIYFIISLIQFYSDVLSFPNREGFYISGPFAALFYCLLVIGLLNRARLIRSLAFIQIGLQLLIYGSLMFNAFANKIVKIGYAVLSGIQLDLGKTGILILCACVLSIQIYKAYVLLRKDVRMLFADSGDPDC